jgi:hypothetical protein
MKGLGKLLHPCFSCFALGYWIQSFLLDPLEESAVAMAHLDPTEIKAVAYPLERLGYFVGLTITSFMLLSIPWWHPTVLWNYVTYVGQGTIVSYLAMILCGADPWNNVAHTIWTSLYMANLALMNPCLSGPAPASFVSHVNQLLEFNGIIASSQFYGTLFGIIPFQILNVLDWGSQVQRWPLPVLIGSTYGWIGGTVVGMIYYLAIIMSSTSSTLVLAGVKKPS